jgi:hypothetical protein
MIENIDSASAVAEAKERRRRVAREELVTRANELTTRLGDLGVEAEDLVNSDALDHETKMIRLEAAVIVLKGEAALAEPTSASSALSVEERELLDLFREGTLEKIETGAWRDKRWGRLQRERHQQTEAAGAPEATQPPVAEPPAPAEAEPAAPAEPPAPSADEGADKAPEKADASSAPTPEPTPTSASKLKGVVLRGVGRLFERNPK